MPGSERRKGTEFRHETAALWRRHGHSVAELQQNAPALLDNLVTLPSGLVLAEECKRTERAKISEWLPELVQTAPNGTVPILTWRRSRWPSWTLVPTDRLAQMLAVVNERPPS